MTMELPLMFDISSTWFNREDAEAVRIRVAEAKLRAIFDNCFQFIALLNEQGRLLEINQASLKAAGISRSEVVGHYFWDSFFWTQIISPQYREQFILSWPRVCQGEFVRFEVSGCLPNGEARTVDFSANPVHDESGRICYVVAEARDITRYKLLETELREKNHRLSSMNGELENFAVLASHDLRQPLQSISMNTAVLGHLLPANAGPEVKTQLQHIQSGVNRMNVLLESILDFARSTKSSQERTQIQASELITEVLESLASSIEEGQATIEVDWDNMPQIFGNRLQLMRVFQNLISNAIKFRDQSRPCVIKIESKTTKDHIQISISDNGIGIHPNDQTQLFARFIRIQSKKNLAGIGAGLSVCREILEQHGGSIWVESQPGQGSTFFFSLPFSGTGKTS
jgi:chemotaxis family two-component system sensor kinase Cph1